MNSHPSETDIAALAHRYYEEEGHPEGKAEEHWARAVQELQQQNTRAPASLSSEDDLQREKERDTQASGKMG